MRPLDKIVLDYLFLYVIIKCLIIDRDILSLSISVICKKQRLFVASLFNIFEIIEIACRLDNQRFGDNVRTL